jgi:hypothetical protein
MATNTGPLDPSGAPVSNPPTQGPAPAGATASRDTGPLDAIKDALGNMFKGSGEPKQKRTKKQKSGGSEQAPGKEQSAIEKMRDKLADFDEDYKDIGERLLGAFTQMIGYLGPFLFVIWVGSDLGKYYTPVMEAFPAYGLAYTIEGVIAASSVAMGRSFAEVASGKPNYGKTALVVLIWALLNASSAFSLYLVITNNGNVSGVEQLSMIIRVCAIAMGDLGCASVLMFKGRSIQKYIESIRKRATAIGELADAQRGIEEADKNAALREQMMKSTLKIQEDLSNKIGDAVSMVMESILEKMEKSLKDDTQGKKERGYGAR